MAVYFFDQEISPSRLKRRKLKTVLKDLIRNEGKDEGIINVIFCTDSFLLRMNQEHLGHDTYTDVITFDFVSGNFISGDVYVSYDRIKENARMHAQKTEVELVRVIGHGVAHLLGYGDKLTEEKEEMTRMEEKIISRYLD